MTHIDTLIDRLLQEQPVTEAINLSFANCTIRVQSDSSTLITQLRRYYEPFVTSVDHPEIIITALERPEVDLKLTYQPKAPEPNKPKIKEEYVDLPGGRVVRKRLTGMHFIFGGGRHLTIGPCVANDNQVINFINNRFMAWKLRQGCLLYHAAAVATHGRGVALSGFSGMGKSTLALKIMSLGADFVSNDRLMVQGTGPTRTMFGVPKLPRINPGTILNNPNLLQLLTPEEQQRFSALSRDELWKLEHKYDAYISQCFGPGRFHLQAEMQGLIVLNWQRSSQPLQIRRVDLDRRQDLMPAFMKSVGLFFGADPEEFTLEAPAEHYLAQLVKLPVIELTGGVDFGQAAEWVWRTMQSGNWSALT
ncbi:MAG: hypothetical protein HJJLKODD_02798 [Phycisphaerae bacterium]|nr:hypothetical protein [Phycisphaerae bacterium]